MTHALLVKHARKFAALLASVLVALLGVGLLALPAQAADGNPALIDPSRTANLLVHKFEQPVAKGQPANGLPQNTEGLKPLGGIEFQVQRVSNIDLTTNAGWEQAANLSAQDAQNGPLDPAVKKVTDADGNAAFNTLPLGLYLVRENLTAAQMASGITGTAPFLVTLPLTNPDDRDSWLYDVNVYPKNNVDSVSKTVDDSHAIKLGDVVTWHVTSSIPAGGVTDRYTVTDQLDSRLTYKDSTVALNGSSVSLVSGTDYTLSNDNGLLTLDFTQAGRTKLDQVKQQNPDATVPWSINTQVNSVGDGVVKNQAVLYPNSTNSNGVPSNTPETRWAGVTLQKVDAVNGNKLSGAHFKVYPTEQDAKNNTNAIVINGQDTWSSGTDGLVNINGLRASNWRDGAEITDQSQWNNYWVVETRAPEGYEVLSQPVQVSAVDNDQSTVELVVKNTPHNAGFTLPFTGGAGTGYFLIGGSALLLVALGIYLYTRSKRRNLAQA